MKYIVSLLLLFSVSITIAQNNIISFPVFSLLKMDSLSYLTNKDLQANKNTVFINFSPTCEHCQRTIKSILENIRAFKQTQFVLSSFEDLSSIRKFYFDNMLDAYTTVFIGQEKGNELTTQVKYTSFPCLVLFDQNKQWIKKIDKESDAKTLLKALKIK